MAVGGAVAPGPKEAASFVSRGGLGNWGPLGFQCRHLGRSYGDLGLWLWGLIEFNIRKVEGLKASCGQPRCPPFPSQAVAQKERVNSHL